MAKPDWASIDSFGLQLALDEARMSYEQGGIPIGSVLLILDKAEPKGFRILGSGHNERIQKASPTLHGEISALEDAGRLRAGAYRKATILSILSENFTANLISSTLVPVHDFEVNTCFSPFNLIIHSVGGCSYPTLSPCSMCSGAISLYKIPRVVIGENQTFMGDEALLRSRGVEIVVLNNNECKQLMQRFISEKPEEWNEDIGEVNG